jgi:hypothetical protein
MESFIKNNLMNKKVDIYCGGPDYFRGKIVDCTDGVITLEWNIKEIGYEHIIPQTVTKYDVSPSEWEIKEEGYTYIMVDKILAIWEVDQQI